MADTILLVDDELNVVHALQRSLGRAYRLEIAGSPAEALEAVRRNVYAVVVSDLKMPSMSGIELLSKIKETSPDTVRILLTGHVDIDAAIAAVNEGNVFRFLTKPCKQTVLAQTLDAALEQYRLIVAEREVLHETLMGTVNVLVEILSAIQPVAFGRTSRIRLYVQHLAQEMQLKSSWELEAAAALSQTGCIAVPGRILRKYCSGEELSEDELVQVQSHPHVAAKLLQNIPRLRSVARMIECQLQPFDPEAEIGPDNYEVVLGAQLLRVAHDFDRYIRHGLSWGEAVSTMALHSYRYNPEVLAALQKMDPAPAKSPASTDFSPENGIADGENLQFRSIADRVLRLLRA